MAHLQPASQPLASCTPQSVALAPVLTSFPFWLLLSGGRGEGGSGKGGRAREPGGVQEGGLAEKPGRGLGRGPETDKNRGPGPARSPSPFPSRSEPDHRVTLPVPH